MIIGGEEITKKDVLIMLWAAFGVLVQAYLLSMHWL